MEEKYEKYEKEINIFLKEREESLQNRKEEVKKYLNEMEEKFKYVDNKEEIPELKEGRMDLEKINKEVEKIEIETKGIKEDFDELQKLENEIVQLNKAKQELERNRSEALVEIENNGAGKEEALNDILKIDTELKDIDFDLFDKEDTKEDLEEEIDEFVEKYNISKRIEDREKNTTEIKPEEDKDDTIDEKPEEDRDNTIDEKPEEDRDDIIDVKPEENKDNTIDKEQENSAAINYGEYPIDIVLDVSNNKIEIDDKNTLFYREEKKNKKEFLADDEFAIKSFFYKDKKIKNIDYALLSTLAKIDKTLPFEYLNVLMGGGRKGCGTREESLTKIKNVVNIKYKFNEENGVWVNYKEKRLARAAHKLGLAELEGVSEKGFFDNLKEKIANIKNGKLLNGRKIKALESGEKDNSIRRKASLANDYKDVENIREQVKIYNKDNIIEKTAQKKYEEESRKYEETRQHDVKNILNSEDERQ